MNLAELRVLVNDKRLDPFLNVRLWVNGCPQPLETVKSGHSELLLSNTK